MPGVFWGRWFHCSCSLSHRPWPILQFTKSLARKQPASSAKKFQRILYENITYLWLSFPYYSLIMYICINIYMYLEPKWLSGFLIWTCPSFGGFFNPKIEDIHFCSGLKLKVMFLCCCWSSSLRHGYTPGSSNIAGWKMGAPDGVDVFPIKHGDFPLLG